MQINITYENKNISQDLAPLLLNFSCTDNSGGNADDLNISLEDRDGKFLNTWAPSKGDNLRVSLEQENKILPLGIFEVDQLEYSSPPRVLNIKAVSAPVKGKITNEKHNRAWENVRLSEIAKDIAGSGGLEIFYDVEEDFIFERREQNNKSDLEFLKELCASFDLNVKISDGKIIIFSREKYEGAGSVSEITSTDKKIISWKFTSKVAGIYKGARLKYYDAAKNENYRAEITDESTEGTGKILELSDRVESISQAREIAGRKLKSMNAKEITGIINLAGDLRFLAGVNITCSGFGIFDGKYLITRVTHNISRSGFTSEISLSMGQEAKAQSKKRRKKIQSASRELYYEGENYYRK